MNGQCDIPNCKELAYVYWSAGNKAPQKAICKNHWQQRDVDIDLFAIFGFSRTEQATYFFLQDPVQRHYSHQYDTVDNEYAII